MIAYHPPNFSDQVQWSPLGRGAFAAGGFDAAQNLPNQPAGAKVAVVIVSAQAARYRDDGTDPTVALGLPQPVATPLYITGESIGRARVIAQVAGGVMEVLYYGQAPK